jgi:conjugal transfer mating pair stabilization protein TraN
MKKILPILTLLFAGSLQAGPQTFLCPEGQVVGANGCEPSKKPAHVIGYTCPSGSVLDGDKCLTTTTIPATVSYTCPEGAKLSGKTCIYPHLK